jgi:methylglyoxal reductase
MLTRTLGSSDLKVSIIGLGTMSWPQCRYGLAAETPVTADEQKIVTDTVRAAFESGITLIDTAEGYGRGRSEELLGVALKELHLRDKIVLVTKVGPLFSEEQIDGRQQNLSHAHIRDRIEKQLRRLQTDHIDLYLAHHPDALTPIEETAETMRQLKQEGKIRWFGLSNHSNQAVQRAQAITPVIVNQLPYSMIDRKIDADQTPYCIEHHVSIMAYSPLGKGVLSGKYDANHLPPPEDYRHTRPYFAKANLQHHLDIAARARDTARTLGATTTQFVLAWTVAQPGITVTIPGARSPEQVRDNAAAGNLQLPTEILSQFPGQ